MYKLCLFKNIFSFIYYFSSIFFRNPTQGIIINHPNGKDVYKGVLHDYTGKVTNSKYNFFSNN